MNSATKLGGLILGGSGIIAAAVLSAARDDSSIIKGDQIFETTDNSRPQVVVDTNPVQHYESGSTNVFFAGYQIGSGSDISLVGDLTLTEVDGVSSGTLSIQNPTDRPLLCDRVTFDVTTASSPVTVGDFGTSTGTVAAGTTTGETLFNNIRLSAGLHTASGTSVTYATGAPKEFKLDAAGGTNDWLTFISPTHSGSGLTGKYNVRCRFRN